MTNEYTDAPTGHQLEFKMSETSQDRQDSSETLSPTAELLSTGLNYRFADFISTLCNDKATGWNCIRVSGQVDFKIDEQQVFTVQISEMTILPALSVDTGNSDAAKPDEEYVSEREEDLVQPMSIEPQSSSEYENVEDQEEWSKITKKKKRVVKPGAKLRGRPKSKVVSVKCEECGKKCRNSTILLNHRCAAKGDNESSSKGDNESPSKGNGKRKSKSSDKFTCEICLKTFTTLASLCHHKRGMHDCVKPYTCKLCPKTFSFHHSLKLHTLKHEGKRPYPCTMCNKSYLTNSHLKTHVLAIHSNWRPHQCAVCDKTFPYENSLKFHMMLHTNEKPHLCMTCGKSFVSGTALRNHEATHKYREKNLECEVCHKMYKSQILLKAHMKRHTSDVSRFVCDLCGRTFMFKSNLDVHMASHGEERNYKCPQCDKSFKTPSTLHSHFLVHQVDSPFSCKTCSKSFKRRDRLLAHEKRHLGDRPFQCDLCGHCFPDKGGLTKHRKTVHSTVKKFACPVCNKTCSRADNLRTHMKVHNDPNLLKLTHAELMVADYTPELTEEQPEQPEQVKVNKQNEQAASAAFVSGDAQPEYESTRPSDHPQPGASSDFKAGHLRQWLTRPVMEGVNPEPSVPMVFQVGQDGQSLYVADPKSSNYAMNQNYPGPGPGQPVYPSLVQQLQTSQNCGNNYH